MELLIFFILILLFLLFTCQLVLFTSGVGAFILFSKSFLSVIHSTSEPMDLKIILHIN